MWDGNDTQNAKDDQLNLRNTGRLVVAGLAIVSALTITACSDNSDNNSTASTSAAASTSSGPAAPPVNAAVINAELQKVLDPATPFAEKVTYLQGMGSDPQLANKLQKLWNENNVKVTINSVTPTGGNTAQATGTMTINGKATDPSQEPVVPLVYEDG
jgi:ABC-type glycerol-3-phosphate transport system substrate-binding protein